MPTEEKMPCAYDEIFSLPVCWLNPKCVLLIEYALLFVDEFVAEVLFELVHGVVRLISIEIVLKKEDEISIVFIGCYNFVIWFRLLNPHDQQVF